MKFPLDCLPQILADVLHFAVVGVGWFGSKRISALRELKMQANGLSMLTRSRGSEAAKEANANYTQDLEQVLSDRKVDCVLVCTPNVMHPKVVLDALRSNKHVLCEKPLARTSRRLR